MEKIMDNSILQKISNLAFYGFFDPSKNMVTVHFFNEESEKPDIIAYLRHDMSWDVREITGEVSVLNDNYETVTILHNCLGFQANRSVFDEFVRKGLIKMAEEAHGNDVELTSIDRMFEVFEKNSYEIDELNTDID